MGHSDSSGTGTQNPRSGHSNSSKSVNDKYSLFPTANHPPRVSSKPLQQQAHQRIPSFSNRRSLSLDESSRPHGVARMPFSRPGDAQLPRLQKVPANRVTVTKPDGQDRTCMSLGHRRLSKANEPEAQAPKILSYKPRISEDAGHGRSSSAPDDMRAELRTRKPTGLAQMTNAALASSAKAVRGPGGTWYNPHDSTIGGPTLENSPARRERCDPRLQKPLPLPPRDMDSLPALDPYHSRSHSTPLSPGPGRSYFTAVRADSLTELTPLVTPSSLDPSRRSYFPLSSDAQMRELMGFNPIEGDQGRVPELPLLLPSSRYQAPVAVPSITVNAASTKKQATSEAHHGAQDIVQQVVVPADHTSLLRPSMASPTLSQASSQMVPAALHITSPKRSMSASSGLDKRSMPLQTKPYAADDVQSTRKPSISTTPKDDEIAKTLSVLSELTAQTNTLHARYATLREERQELLSGISSGLKVQKAGPDYVNTIFDQHMSLATVCSSMDICLAKLKAVSRRKDTLIKTLAKHTQKESPLPSTNDQKFTPPPTSTATPSTFSSLSASLSTHTSLQPLEVISSHPAPGPQYPDPPHRFHSQLDTGYDTDASDTPRRMNIKGVKAARILGLDLEPDNNNINPGSNSRSSESNATRPTKTLKANHSTTSLDRDLFTREPTPPRAERPLPAHPSIRMKQRDHIPPPLPLKPGSRSVVEKTSSHAAQHSVSSRASSPADDRGAETPLEEHPAFDAKSPGMQTVHVYFPDSMSGATSLQSSTFSEVGEDELLAYYGYLR
jgi:hypothetical protein